MKEKDAEPPKNGAHYELLALTTEAEQKVDGLFDAHEWQGGVDHRFGQQVRRPLKCGGFDAALEQEFLIDRGKFDQMWAVERHRSGGRRDG